jgi:hypothetical protein
MDIGIYFGGKVTDSQSDNDSMYALFSADLKENRDAVGGFGSCFPAYMGLHYINDPQHHTYYRQGTNRDELTLKTEKLVGEGSEKKMIKNKRLRV